MLAEDYGYWISPRRAFETGPTKKWIPEEVARRASSAGWNALACLSGAVIAFLIAYNLGEDSGGSPGLIVFFFWAGSIVLGFCGLVYWLRNMDKDLKSVFPTLYRDRWQAWPCQVVGVPPVEGAKTVEAKITLLDPERKPVQQFYGPMHRGAWGRMTDGFGVLWICGSLHEPVAVAEPGGAPVWAMSTENKKGTVFPGGPGLLDTVVETVVKEASAAATQRLLDEMGW